MMNSIAGPFDCHRRKKSIFEGASFGGNRYECITSDRTSTAKEVVFSANDRCDQENLIAQLKNGVRSMRNPLDNLHSNRAYMVMSSLVWTLNAWCGLLLPVTPGAPAQKHRAQKRSILKMESKGSVNISFTLTHFDPVFLHPPA